jgi:hypothetical protein
MQPVQANGVDAAGGNAVEMADCKLQMADLE